MERYGQTQPDPVAEWSSPAGQTGLEEPMWHMGLGTGSESYPERHGDPDCIYYLRTGFCGYGARCRFNHPRDRSAAVGYMRAAGAEYPERVGQPVCKYYMRMGMCKYGASCKYHHPRQGAGSVSPVTPNIYGYPLRAGEKECSYYVKTGQCKFGVSCKFHHPQPAGVQVSAPAGGPLPPPAAVPAPTIYQTVQSPSVQSSQQYGVVAGNWTVPRHPLLPGSYLPGTYSHVMLSPGMVPIPGWNPYSAPVASPSTHSTLGAGQIYGITQLSPSAPAYSGPYLSISSTAGPSGYQKEQTFPERPSQPECQYYMKTGDCKFGSSCRYHHPPEWRVAKTNFVLGLMGLPLRPGAPVCSHYAQNGACRFGSSCKFDHPTGTLSYSPSPSSLTDVPVAPYPVGASIGILAPSSSSADLRPELIYGSNKDIVSTRVSSSINTSSRPISSIYSASGGVSHSGVQLSGQISTTSTGSSSTGTGGGIHTSG